MSEMIDITNTDLGVENLGEMWEDFIARCTPEQATLFNESYNLIAISFPESFIDNTITHLLVDDSISTSDLMAHIRILFIDTIIDALQMMGILFDKDYIDPNSLKELNVILDTIYLADGLTDIIGLVDTLNDEIADPKERFIRVVRMTQPQYDMENMEYYIRDVSTNTIRGLLIGINVIDEDDTDWVDPYLQKRIKGNKEFLKTTLAVKHIADGGGIGLMFDGYFKVFANELAELLVTDQIAYLRNILGLMLISSLTDTEIVGQYTSLVDQHCESVEELYKGTNLLNEVNINA